MNMSQEAPFSSFSWLASREHIEWLNQEVLRQLNFFAPSLRDGQFRPLTQDGEGIEQDHEGLLHISRLVYSYALARNYDFTGFDNLIDEGIGALTDRFWDKDNGGFFSIVSKDSGSHAPKTSYTHAFVLLAAAAAYKAGHPKATALIDHSWDILETRLFDGRCGLVSDDWHADWSSGSDYRGFNANMHTTEALLAAHMATGDEKFLKAACSIIEFFVSQLNVRGDFRIPEHYNLSWETDLEFSGDEVFKPKGTTPGHSLEFARLILEATEQAGRPIGGGYDTAELLKKAAFDDAYNRKSSYLIYTVDYDGTPLDTSILWWPLTEAISLQTRVLRFERQEHELQLYSDLWRGANQLFIDIEAGGWFPEIDVLGNPIEAKFKGKPDIYHSLQAALFSLDVAQAM